MKHTDDMAANILHEQVSLFYKYTLQSSITAILVAMALASLQWNFTDHKVILIWLVIITLMYVGRIILALNYHQKKPTPQDILPWKRNFYIVTVLTALAWSSTSLLLFPAGNFVQQAITIIILVSVSSSSVTSLSAMKSISHTFNLLVLAPLAIVLLNEDGQTANTLALLCIALLFFLKSMTESIYDTHMQNILFRIESNQNYLENLKSEEETQQTSSILEMVATGENTKDIYESIILLYESRHPNLRCSILEFNGKSLKCGAAPNLPQPYCNTIVEISNQTQPSAFSFHEERVLIENISLDESLSSFKQEFFQLDIQSVWSEPIRNISGNVLGTFNMHCNYPDLPSHKELANLESAAKLVAIVMEREQREALLQKLYSAFEYAQDAIMITDLEARIEYVNPSFERITGYPSSESIGEFTTILRSKQHSEEFYINFYNQCRQGKHWQGEITIQCKDGSLLETERNVSPVFDNNGEIIFFVAIMRDLTEKRLLEKQFQQAQKMEAIGTLVGGIAHDFNNILAGITGNIFLAKKSMPDSPETEIKLDRIDQLSLRAADLIKQLLTFARKDTVHMKSLELNILIKDSFKFLRSSLPENIDMNLNVADKSIYILGDSTQIHQLLLNLTNNAYDALKDTQNPSISLELSTHTVTYHDYTPIPNHPILKSGDYAHIIVQDNGIGIPQDKLAIIFEPFFTMKPVGQGTGLGLSMVFGAVERHHGYIHVDSRENIGTTFHVYLPLTHTQEDNTRAHQKTSPTSGHHELILLVDDEIEILDMGTEVLNSLGYRVIQAKNGKEAITVFKKYKNDIDLILTDIVMPKLSGVDSIQEIRKIKPNVKVIFSTGYDKNTELARKVITNKEAVLNKPFSIDLLSQVIRHKLSKRPRSIG